MKFGTPWFGLAAVIWVSVIALYFTVATRKRNRFFKAFSPSQQKGIISFSDPMLLFKRVILITALILATFAAMRPQLGQTEVNLSAEGIDVAVVFDVSLSMLAEDEEGQRFEKGQRLLIDAVTDLTGDRIALVPFAGAAFLQLPLTADYSTALAVISGLNPGMISTQGTSLEAAIDLAADTLSSGREGADRLIVIISDGEDPQLNFDHVKERLDKIQASAAILPLGSVEGAPIRVGDNYLTDPQGQMVVSKRNTAFFEKCTASLGALEIKKGETLAQFIKEFKNRGKGEEKRFEIFTERFQLPLALAIILYLLFLALPLGRKREVT